MELQTTKFIPGGIDALENEIRAQEKEDRRIITTINDDGDIFAVFRKNDIELNPATLKTVRIASRLHDLSKSIDSNAEKGLYVNMMTTDGKEFLILFAKPYNSAPSISTEQSIANYEANFGCD